MYLIVRWAIHFASGVRPSYRYGIMIHESVVVENTSRCVLRGHIVSDKPEVMGCFGSMIIKHPCSGDPAGVDQPPTSVQVAHYCTAPPSGAKAILRLSPPPLWSMMARLHSWPFTPRTFRKNDSWDFNNFLSAWLTYIYLKKIYFNIIILLSLSILTRFSRGMEAL